MKLKIPSYLDVLEAASVWRTKSDPASLESARQILEQGMKKHLCAPALVDELALVLEKLGLDGEARELLDAAAAKYEDPGEETLARFGKIYKKLADSQIGRGHHAAAAPLLAESERWYGDAFAKAHGFYPRINQLSARFLRGGLANVLRNPEESDRLVQSAREDAEKMLADPLVWVSRNPDDNVWIPATQGEANVLLANWPDAANAYREAIRQAGGRQFYHDAMRDQISKQHIPAYRMRGQDFGPVLATPDEFFRIDPNAKNINVDIPNPSPTSAVLLLP